MNKLFGFAIFVAGLGIGSGATWIFAKKKYSKIAQEEIDSVKNALANKKEVFVQKDVSDNDSKQSNNQAVKATKALNKKSITDYSSFSKYEELSKKYSDKETDKKLGKEVPYVITPEEFGELYDYEKVSLTYYKDGVLTDDNDDVIDDVDVVIGVDSLDHFGEYEDDSVYVRNDQRMCDYEILLDNRTYSEAMKQEKPYLHQDDDDGEEE